MQTTPKDSPPRASAAQTRRLLTKFFRGQGMASAEVERLVGSVYADMLAAKKQNPRSAAPKT